MSIHTSECLEFNETIKATLKLDPEALASLGSKRGSGRHTAADGLHELIRMMLDRAYSLLWCDDDFTLRLHTEADARALDSDRRIEDLVELCAWALIRTPRRARGRGDLKLAAADPAISYSPRRTFEPGTRPSVHKLVRGAAALFDANYGVISDADYGVIRDAPAPCGTTISICALITETFGLKPEMLIRPYYGTMKAAKEAFARDPEGQAFAGLAALLLRTIRSYQPILDWQKALTADCDLMFKIEPHDTYQGVEGAAACNLAQVLKAGCFADGTRTLLFMS